MRRTIGTLADLTTALNQAITELTAPGGQASGTLSSATARVNALVTFLLYSLPQADGTLADASRIYNAIVLRRKGAFDVHLFLNNFASGTTVTFARRTMDVTVNYIEGDGTQVSLTENVVFPDILSSIPVDRRDDILKELIVILLKIKHGWNE